MQSFAANEQHCNANTRSAGANVRQLILHSAEPHKSRKQYPAAARSMQRPFTGSAAAADLRERLLHVAQPVQVQIGISAIALHGDDLQVAAEVARIEARDGQAIAVAGQHGRAVSSLAVHVHVRKRRLRSGVEVGPNAWQARPRNAAPLIRHLYSVIAISSLSCGHPKGHICLQCLLNMYPYCISHNHAT